MATVPGPAVIGYLKQVADAIEDDVAIQSMWDKRRYATHIVSNLTFDAGAIKAWVGRMRARGITMPLLLGVPGPVQPGEAGPDLVAQPLVELVQPADFITLAESSGEISRETMDWRASMMRAGTLPLRKPGTWICEPIVA